MTDTSDNYHTPEVGDWAEEKYRLLGCYASLFATSMKRKWDQRVYIDLFSGAGKARIRGTSRIVNASPLVALGIDDPFNRYIFCESNADYMKALKSRVTYSHLESDVRYVSGDANDNVGLILQEMPPYGTGASVLGFCFVDPFRARDLQFETIRQLSERYMDFLILIPTGMDFQRNEDIYLDESNTLVANFTGLQNWRERWISVAQSGKSFGSFIVEMYSEQMKTLGYHHGDLRDSVHIRSSEKNLALYRLVFFSRHKLGKKFWDEARKYTNRQRTLF